MTNKINAGDAVQIVAREAVSADVKSQLYFPHYQGLTGSIAKVYDDGTAGVNIDVNSLPDEIKNRHISGSEAMRQKWLDGLSEEARNRLSAAEKKFGLRYTILVSLSDLTGISNTPAAAPSKQAAAAEAAPARKSLADLEAEEARHLEEIRQQKNNS